MHSNTNSLILIEADFAKNIKNSYRTNVKII